MAMTGSWMLMACFLGSRCGRKVGEAGASQSAFISKLMGAPHSGHQVGFWSLQGGDRDQRTISRPVISPRGRSFALVSSGAAALSVPSDSAHVHVQGCESGPNQQMSSTCHRLWLSLLALMAPTPPAGRIALRYDFQGALLPLKDSR